MVNQVEAGLIVIRGGSTQEKVIKKLDELFAKLGVYIDKLRSKLYEVRKSKEY